MPRYHISYTATYTESVEIEADNRDEAIAIFDADGPGQHHPAHDPDPLLEITGIEVS